MRNCASKGYRGIELLWILLISRLSIMSSKQIFPPWHYYWILLSVHCDKKLIISFDIWWIAFIKVPGCISPFFFLCQYVLVSKSRKFSLISIFSRLLKPSSHFLDLISVVQSSPFLMSSSQDILEIFTFILILNFPFLAGKIRSPYTTEKSGN